MSTMSADPTQLAPPCDAPAASTPAFEYTPPPFFASDSRVPRWLQASIANAYIFVTIHYNLWMLPFLLAFAVMYQVPE